MQIHILCFSWFSDIACTFSTNDFRKIIDLLHCIYVGFGYNYKIDYNKEFLFYRSDDETMLLQFLQDSESQWPRRSRPTRHTTPSSASKFTVNIYTIMSVTKGVTSLIPSIPCSANNIVPFSVVLPIRL